uniref:Anoctamin transmembrane domain-containing protein n=1 Tax=Noctiluca scintillans TaxID=2966 RepID=A0A6T8VTH0_NOCSC
MEPEHEPARPEHHGQPRINPVTSEVENHYPEEKRFWWHVTSFLFVAISGVLVLMLILGVFMLRHFFYKNVKFGRINFMILLAVLIEVANFIATHMSNMLTRWENHRTQTEFETWRLIKAIGFKFVNSYFALYYLAFFKEGSTLFGVEMHCFRDECFLELQAQLGIIGIVHFVARFVTAFVIPRCVSSVRRANEKRSMMLENLQYRSSTELADMSAAERQFLFEKPSVFQDFDERLITHGYATLFAVTSPWVPFAVLLAAGVTLVFDVHALTSMRRRPMPTRCRDCNPFTAAFDIYGHLAAFTNIMLIIFSSDQYRDWTLTEKLVFFAFMENVVLFAIVILKSLLPAKPRIVTQMQLKQQVMVHRCLNNIPVEQNQDFAMHMRQGGGARLDVLEEDVLEQDNDDAEPEMNLKDSVETGAQALGIWKGRKKDLPK